ncbi:solute carrier family 12 member 8-like isoform X2 [Artemia franciscana]|uniref:Solute carrier family 12 member 8 n=2 Tax=Artemia franciscana TaxID=6661 RepID=A0AA88IC96_ARTSF|nr:hypothetical protein QYM36_000392 [Artemia franciscana]KAK2725901.1 hypothetical protein QYM36_000392 [Artemia franciscana]
MNDETVKNGRKTWLNEGSQQMSGYTEIETRPADLIEDGCEGDFSRVNELYQQEQGDQPWWKSQFFISQPVLFGTWDGVFTSVMINIFGVIIFLRSGWIVANAGIGLGVLIVLCSVSVVLISVLSAIGICERCKVESGGVYFLLSHVLGSRIGGAVGLLYCFGQSVGGALCLMGFAESISSLITVEESAQPWIQRAMATAVVFLLGGLNLAGVKWVIKLQFLLLATMLLAALDFFIGSFINAADTSLLLPDIINGTSENGTVEEITSGGFVGWNGTVMSMNAGPDFMDGETWFSVFGVFFPTATGVMAGINMSGDLKNPSKDIPTGTLAALGVSTFLYLSFMIVLGATCERSALFNDYLIVAKVSAVELLLLAGLYISSLSSSLGAFYGTPRVLQSIASQKVIPVIRVLAHGRGPNRLPIYALMVTSIVTLLFIWIGQLNTLAPIVTMPFLLTYAFIDYAYFALAQTFNIQQMREERFKQQRAASPHIDLQMAEVVKPIPKVYGAGTPDSIPSDLDMLFPERLHHRNPTRRQNSESSNGLLSSPDDHSSLPSEDVSSVNSVEVNGTAGSRKQNRKSNIGRKSRSWYSTMSNRWVSLFGVFIKISIMFAVNWIYALVCIGSVFVVWVYIGQANPGVNPGVSADFKMFTWLRQCFEHVICKKRQGYEQIVVPSGIPDLDIQADQLTEENDDFSSRSRYHQSSTVKGKSFDLADSQEVALVP